MVIVAGVDDLLSPWNALYTYWKGSECGKRLDWIGPIPISYAPMNCWLGFNQRTVANESMVGP